MTNVFPMIINVTPLHTCFAIFYIVSLFLLLVVALKNNRQLNKKINATL